jgi:hypothetical protein
MLGKLKRRHTSSDVESARVYKEEKRSISCFNLKIVEILSTKASGMESTKSSHAAVTISYKLMVRKGGHMKQRYKHV